MPGELFLSAKVILFLDPEPSVFSSSIIIFDTPIGRSDKVAHSTAIGNDPDKFV